ncbi:TPA: peptidase [Klebsiella pneumoniae]|uniref:peptidase n=1 Tax=Klebsiella pneumoniae TaxID=573 RepID=UPI0027394F90|nr:peptidase [Klebsiella pneumoniae]HBR7581863.1 peptidase [Klebsiella pneumoniae]
MNLFERLLHRRLCNEQPADGGAAPAPSEPAVPAADAPAPVDQAKPEGDEKQPGVEGDKPQDDKPADGEKPKDKPAEEKEQKQEGAPEKYEFQAGEGVELDVEALKDFEPVARELNLTNEQAQKLVDAYPKILAGVQQRQAEAWQAQTEQWAADVKADKEIGGDKLTANLSAAQRALEQFGDQELKEYLDSTGLGNHPALVKAFIKVGKAMSEDKVVTGGHESGGSDLISAFYPKK